MERLNEFIYDALVSNSALTNLVNDNIFVVDVPESTDNPVIQFARIIESNHNKLSRNDKATILMNIYTDDYYSGCDIVKMVTDTIDRKSDKNNGINGIYRESVREVKSEYAHIQTITFNVS
ncbi:hypothetical protein [Carboxylicivirga sp. RSCT41]|uniref:hypothetical protein n=1 Tax=Carboxylicivirga agarovorans TaxID=3417570 RepID=UPI003D33E76D